MGPYSARPGAFRGHQAAGPPGRRKKIGTSTIPVPTPPTWAHHATPPPPAPAPREATPEKNCKRNHSGRYTTAGIETDVTKKPKMASERMRARGNKTR